MAKIAILQRKPFLSGKSGSEACPQEEIGKLAYQFFVDRGYEHGHDQEDWIRAEKIIKSRKF